MGLDPVLLWLWFRPEATAGIRSLAQELPHAMGAALKRKRKYVLGENIRKVSVATKEFCLTLSHVRCDAYI